MKKHLRILALLCVFTLLLGTAVFASGGTESDRTEKNGDGFTMFDGAPLLQDSVKIDNQVLIDYIVDTLGDVIGDEYADPYGQGRIVIVE